MRPPAHGSDGRRRSLPPPVPDPAAPSDRGSAILRAALVVATALIVLAPGGATPAAAAGKPPAQLEIIPRSVWDPRGACRPRRPAPRVAPRVRRAIVHHTVHPRRYPRHAGSEVVRDICRSHLRRGFNDIGYHFLVDRWGRVYEGRAGGTKRPLVGAHVSGHNEATFGVAVIGNHQRDEVPEAALDALHRLLAWKFSYHGVTPRAVQRDERRRRGPSVRTVAHRDRGVRPTIVGHRDADATLCPGGHLYAALGDIAHRVAGLMRRGVRAHTLGRAEAAARANRREAQRAERRPDREHGDHRDGRHHPEREPGTARPGPIRPATLPSGEVWEGLFPLARLAVLGDVLGPDPDRPER